MIKIKEFLNIFWRGACMGMADLVPGVSGGTMALLLGIYQRLLASLSGFSKIEFSLFFKGNFVFAIKSAWKKIDGFFILSLGLGILASIFLLAGWIKWLLENREVILLAFFLGLMLATLVILFKELDLSSSMAWINLVLGITFAASLTYLPISLNSDNLVNFYIAGVLASCFMLLPGVSGSFLLLLLGIYAPVIDAIHSMNLKVLLVLALGIATGLIFFSRLLHKLLERFYNGTMALLTGFIAGSLVNLWPWQLVKSYSLVEDKVKIISKQMVSPQAFDYIVGDNYIISAFVFLVIGFVFTFYLNRFGNKDATKKTNSNSN